MATVTATFARVMAAAAGYALSDSGVVSVGDRVMHRVRVDDGNRMTDADYFTLINWITSQHPDRAALVLAYADAIHMDDLGALGLAIRTAPTLRDSLIRAQRYYWLLTDTVRYRLDESGQRAVFSIENHTAPHPVIDFRNECALAAFVKNFIRLGGDGLSFEEIRFRHPCMADPDAYARGLGCPVRFEANEDAIVLRSDMLDLPNRLGDQAVAAFMTAHLDDQISSMPDETSLTDTLLHRLSTSLSNGAPPAAEIARDLGMSERTFYRRLSDEGKTYQGLLQQAQQSLARDLLARSTCSIAEIAFLTGFSEQSTFSRAFKRWCGEPPASFRRTAQGT
jgi:AraC-like DNA-binding protein